MKALTAKKPAVAERRAYWTWLRGPDRTEACQFGLCRWDDSNRFAFEHVHFTRGHIVLI
jgi:hypothetical protein